MNEEQKIQQIDINLLQPNPLQPRGLISPESLVELVDSIREHGILEPLVVAETPAGYQLIAGERRWRASKIAGLTTVPCIVRQASHRGMLEMAIVENIQRVDLNPLERAQGFKQLMDEFSLGTAEIAQRIGKSQSYVANSIRLLTLPDALKDAMISGAVSEGHIRALAAIDDVNMMVDALRQILKEQGSVRRAEELAREMKARANIKPREAGHKIYNEEIAEIQKKLSSLLGHARILQSSRSAKVILTLHGPVDKTTEIIKKLSGLVESSFTVLGSGQTDQRESI